MRKMFWVLLVCLIFSGCSAPAKAPSGVTGQPGVSGNRAQEPQVPAAEPESEQKAPVNSFVGAVGTAPVHAVLNIDGQDVTGSYYYDRHKTDIPLTGSLTKDLKDKTCVSLTEKAEKKGEFYGIVREKDLIVGFWRDETAVHPMYLLREGSPVAAPKPPTTAEKLFGGHWSGANGTYYSGAEADIVPLYQGLVFYVMNAYNGTHSGVLSSIAELESGAAKTVFSDTVYDSKDPVVFEFRVNKGQLTLKSNMYEYMCGAAVAFDTAYVPGKRTRPVPTAREAGIVDTVQQDQQFKALVGDAYETFVSYTASVNYEEAQLDGAAVKAGNSMLLGAPGYCFYVFSAEHMYAAVNDGERVRYFTNDPAYADHLPEPFKEWQSSPFGTPGQVKVEYTLRQ